MKRVRWIILAVAMLCVDARGAPDVRVIRVPQNGLQPQARVDSKGTIHLIYLTGKDPQACDIQYARGTTTHSSISFSDAVRVNAQFGSAIATGTIRGPHLAVGRNDIVHVAWMGSQNSQPKVLGKHNPMLYTRLLASGDGKFEPERNVITKFVGLDGGGTVAADVNGNVYVAWHAPSTPKGDEGTRGVFVARSTDDGATFAPESPVSQDDLGACACCGMELLAAQEGAVVGLFRTATKQVHRDTRAFLFEGKLEHRRARTLDPAEAGICMMSTYALADAPPAHHFVAAWETLGRIRVGAYSYRDIASDPPRDVPGGERNSKHPAVAVDDKGNVLVAWAVGTGWQKGGTVAWQVFDEKLQPIADAAGKADGLPVWSRPAAVATRERGFVILY